MPKINTKFVRLSEEDFDKKFTTIKNHFDQNASWNGEAFETYGQELDFVRKQNPDQIWTMVDGSDDTCFLLSGYHLVNRLYHLLTKESVPENIEYEVELC